MEPIVVPLSWISAAVWFQNQGGSLTSVARRLHHWCDTY